MLFLLNIVLKRGRRYKELKGRNEKRRSRGHFLLDYPCNTDKKRYHARI